MLLGLVLPSVGQEDRSPYFSLNSNATFSPGEKATITVTAQAVRSLDFRLYRVENASEFLSQLPDAHSFGNRTSALPRERTPLERFAGWKRKLRANLQQSVRAQFSDTAKSQWRARSEPAPIPAKDSTAKGTSYAALPVLNEKQLLKSWRENVTTRDMYSQQTVDIPVATPGLYLVEAAANNLRAYTIVSVSQMAVLTKTQPGQAWARVVDRISGRALAGVDVEFRSAQKSHAKTKTDENGFAKFSAEDSSDVFALATRGQDVAFDALSEYALGRRRSERLFGYVYTERPVYRPGHKVFFKAVLRQQAEFGYNLFPAGEVEAEVTDSDGKTLFRRSLAVSKFGTVHGELELPVTASLGYYALRIKGGESNAYGSFNVEEYKKPEYEVKIKASQPRVVQGESVTATIQARYYFGEPVKGAKVKYTVRRAPYYPYWYEPDDADSGYQQTEEDSSGGDFFSGEQGEEKQATLNDNGELEVTLPTPVIDRDYLFRIEARVMDEGNREVTGYGMVTATRGNYMVLVRADRYVASPGQNMSFTVTTKDYDGKPVSADFRAELRRWVYRSENKTISSTTGRTAADGTGKVSFTLPEAGSFILEVTSRSPQGRDIKNTEWVWVSGAYSGGAAEETLKIVSDKKKYAPGDTAKLMVITGEPDVDAWVTTEHRGVVQSQAVRAKDSGGFTVDIPIKSEYQPNVTVKVSFLKRSQLFEGEIRLRVPPVEKQLDLSVSPAKSEFKPGEPARYDILAKDSKGNPVQAELSLGVVDEALYAVQRDTQETPLSAFYGNVYSEVNSSTSLSYYFNGQAGTRAMRLAQLRPSLGQLKPDRVGDPRVRKAFPDTAFWVADLVTNAQGKGSVEFAFPDALTQWRATARAFTADTKVGFALNRVTVRKNLLLRTVTPRFLMEGDKVSIGVIVQNYLSSAKQAKVSLQASGVDLLDGAERTVTVDSKGSQKVEFRVRVKRGAESTLTAKAITDEESDAIEIPLPVKPYGTLLSNGASGALAKSESAKATLRAPGDNRFVEISVSPSLAGSLFGALEYLSTFPYGCTEQTMSSFLPNLTVTRALDQLGVRARINREDLQKKVNAGLERLYDYQHADGAWGWWKNDDSHPFMTAHVLRGLKEAKSLGYPVSDDALRRAQQWLAAEFRRQNQTLPDLRAYIAYSLGRKEDIEEVWSSRARMTSYGLAFLGLALDEAKDPRALEVAQSLESAAKQNAAEAWWPGERDPLLDFPNDITSEITSYTLKLLSRQRPNSPLLPKAATWLVLHKDQGEWWNSTKQTAMVIYGLIDYLKTSKELKPNIEVQVKLNGKTVLTKEFAEADINALAPQVVKLPAMESNDVEISVNGEGRVYWNAQAKYYSGDENRTVSGGGPMSVSREYFRLAPRESAGVTSFALEPLSGDIKPGDAIAVLVSIQAKDRKYLLIEDPIPAGFELVTNDNTYNLQGKPAWWRYSWAQREYRDDRAAFFRTYYYDNDSQFFYVLKAVNPGKFRVPPSRLQPMYEPNQIATGRAAILEVKP
jgi:uncharacterized protein YfaS (alpha-2-macroglobulin family)